MSRAMVYLGPGQYGDADERVPCWRTFTQLTSIHRYGRSPSIRPWRKAFTRWSIFPHSRNTLRLRDGACPEASLGALRSGRRNPLFGYFVKAATFEKEGEFRRNGLKPGRAEPDLEAAVGVFRVMRPESSVSFIRQDSGLQRPARTSS